MDIIHPLDGDRPTADQPCKVGNIRYSDGDRSIHQRWPQARDNGHGKDQRRKRHQDVHDSHEDQIRRFPKISGDHTERGS